MCEDRREERRRRWKWKRVEMVVVRVDICGGVRVERAPMIMLLVAFSSIMAKMGSCAKKRDKGFILIVKCVGVSVSKFVVGSN